LPSAIETLIAAKLEQYDERWLDGELDRDLYIELSRGYRMVLESAIADKLREPKIAAVISARAEMMVASLIRELIPGAEIDEPTTKGGK
jgi:hypothetical protein